MLDRTHYEYRLVGISKKYTASLGAPAGLIAKLVIKIQTAHSTKIQTKNEEKMREPSYRTGRTRDSLM